MKYCIIFYVNDKNITIKQIKHFILNGILSSYIFVLNHNTYASLFSNYGDIFIKSNYKFLSNCYQSVYNSIREKDYEKVIEINPDFFVDYQYIGQCLSNKNILIGSSTYIAYHDNILTICQNINPDINNILFCRCFSKIFLNKINYNIYNFDRNINIFTLSHISCILVETHKNIITQYVYKLMNKDNIDYNMLQSNLISKSKYDDINEILISNIDIYFNQLNIRHIQVSNEIIFFKEKIMNKYNLIQCDKNAQSCLFFGIYIEDDIYRVESFPNTKYILWAGSDIDFRLPTVSNIVKRIKALKDVTHFAISESVRERLTTHNIKNTLINFSLVNIDSYKQVTLSATRVKRIYVYDGNQNDLIYNCTLCKEIRLKLKDKYEFVFRSEINYDEKEMIAFYQSCFLGIRLCENDGNANTVIEMGLLGLPVLHNSSKPNAIPWICKIDYVCEQIDYIDYICEKIDYIYNNYHNKKEIIKESMIKYINNDIREDMCIFVPMYYRHETTMKNLHLLTCQDYKKINIIVIYSNVEDEEFCKSLSHYKNIHPIKVENKPLSKKYQFGAEFCKIFYPYGITINGSDDFLSLNFTTIIYNKFKNTDCNYFGCNYWYVGDTVSMLLYKFTYNDSNRVVGCGRSFKYTLLDDVKWQIFPLNKNSGIDGASKDMIMNKAVPYCENDSNCFTFSFKEETDMITPMSNLLKSSHSIYEIIAQSNLNRILYANNLSELQTAFQLKPNIYSMNRFLFITLLDDVLKKTNPIMLNSYYMESVLKSNFDIIDLRDLEHRKNFDYSIIFIDGICLNTRTTKLNRDMLFKYLSKIKHITKVLLSHDIHDYSYDFENNCQPTYCKWPLTIAYENNILKDNFLNFLKINNIEYIIGICDCPELDNMVKYYSSQIKQFYLMTHHIPERIFQYKGIEKQFDILIYGWSNEIVYPFRNRLKELIKNLPYRVKIIERTSNIDKMPIEHDLADIINESWIVITCISNFSYLVRKYFEIAACGSIPCGNINEQGREIFKYNTIEITEYMSDHEIERIISYYLNNKELLMKMSDEIRILSSKYNYNMFMKNLLEIKDHIINLKDTTLLYEKQKFKYSPHVNNMIHTIANIYELETWVTNQTCTVTRNGSSFIVSILQNTSTPGIKTTMQLPIGEYILIFDIITDLDVKVFMFGKKQVNVNEQSHNCQTCVKVNIIKDDIYTIMVLCTNPKNGSSFTINNPKLKKILSKPLNYNLIPHIGNQIFSNVFIGSMSIVGEIEKLSSIFNTHIINKDNIIKKQYNKIYNHKGYKILILLGLYSPHHWSKYMSLFNLFNKIIIIFTGTDILQLDNEKVSKNMKLEILTYLSSMKVTCAALNVRNMEEIMLLHNLKTVIISIPLKPNIIIPTYAECENKVACYVGNNLDWYNYNIIVKVAKILTSYEFYIYKYEGFTEEFIKEHHIPNIYYNTKTIENIEEFMLDKKCSLRITNHDGEPMTGIESIIMKKPFLFNHDMKYAIKISMNENEISNSIMNLPIYDESEYRAAHEYYFNRNSVKIFERNVKCYYPIFKEKILIISMKNKYYTISRKKDKLYNIEITKLVKRKQYRLLLNGYSDGYVKINMTSCKTINDKYNKIEPFETSSFIDFIPLNDICMIQFDIKTFNKICNIYIRDLIILSN